MAQAEEKKGESSRELMGLPEGTIAEMRVKWEAIHTALGERSLPILTQRFDDNLAEIVAHGDSYSPTDQDDQDIYALRREPGAPWYRAALPRSDYPELYELKDAQIRLGKLIGDMEVQEAIAKKKD